MKRIAIIPARGGSKRIPRKNIKDFLGKPIISYSILTALNSGLFDEVMVSTDDHEIAEIALRYGANVPFVRSKENSQDHSSTVEVLLEVLNWYKLKECYFEQATCIYPCSPLLTIQQLMISFDYLIQDDVDVVFPAVVYSHPIQRAFFLDKMKKIKPVFEIDEFSGTQGFDFSYHDAGMFYSFKTERLFKTQSLRTNNTLAIEISQIDSQDIDDMVDWELAKMKYLIKLNGKL